MSGFEAQAYEIDELWIDDNLVDADKARSRELASIIPDDVQTVVDLGCGSGVFVNSLARLEPRRFSLLCGIDRSRAALSHVRVPKTRATLDVLPFRDGAFDLAACLEVLEHLPGTTYERALAEICRIARSYVLITVPNREDLHRGQVACPECGTRFNADYHMRRFDDARMTALLDAHGFRCERLFHLHRVVKSYVGLSWALSFKKKPYSSYAICPMCGYHREAVNLRQDRREGRHPARAWVLSAWPKRYGHRWVGGLYRLRERPERSRDDRDGVRANGQ